tara:strand:- start:330 stop:488 length:159 start_codon:yes stop_codon:yes gene_type:complete
MLFPPSKSDRKRSCNNEAFLSNSLLAGTVFLTEINQAVLAKPNSIVAVEPLV